MTDYMYSATSNSFYPTELKSEYDAAGSWPRDGKEVENTAYLTFSGPPPEGKIRAPGSDGLPCWVDIPLPTEEDIIVIANSEKSNLLVLAHQAISVWQTELQLGIISDADKTKLTNWLTYIKKLSMIDTGSAALGIEWPTKPV